MQAEQEAFLAHQPGPKEVSRLLKSHFKRSIPWQDDQEQRPQLPDKLLVCSELPRLARSTSIGLYGIQAWEEATVRCVCFCGRRNDTNLQVGRGAQTAAAAWPLCVAHLRHSPAVRHKESTGTVKLRDVLHSPVQLNLDEICPPWRLTKSVIFFSSMGVLLFQVGLNRQARQQAPNAQGSHEVPHPSFLNPSSSCLLPFRIDTGPTRGAAIGVVCVLLLRLVPREQRHMACPQQEKSREDREKRAMAGLHDPTGSVYGSWP